MPESCGKRHSPVDDTRVNLHTHLESQVVLVQLQGTTRTRCQQALLLVDPTTHLTILILRDTELKGSSTFNQVYATDQEATLDTSQVFVNPAISSVVEQDSESSRNDKVSDFVTSENIGDFRYSRGATPDRDLDYEYESYEIDFF